MEEDLQLDFNFELNLQRLCIIKIVTSLWEKEEIKQKVILFFQRSYNRYEEENSTVNWNKLTSKVLSLLRNLSLPSDFKKSMKHVTKSIGKQIFNWTKYVTKVLEFNIMCAQDIFWTHYGTIDKKRIFKLWLEERKLESDQLFNMACIFCLEEYILDLWIEMPDHVKNTTFYHGTIYGMSRYNLIAYWKNVLIDGRNQYFISSLALTERARLERLRNANLVDRFEYDERRLAWLYIFTNSNSIEENMLRVSVFEGVELAVKYFWNKLSIEERVRNVGFSMHTIKAKSEEPEYAEILIFLTTKLSIQQNITIHYEEFFILEILLKNWPWEEFFMPVLDRILKCYENSTDRSVDNYDTKFFYLIQTIVDMMKTDFALYKSVEGTMYQIILHETWEKIPESSKVLVAGKQDWSIFSKLLNIEDFKSLKMIINHELFREKYRKRSSFISCMRSLFVRLESERKVELVKKFVNEVGIDEAERLKFRDEFCYYLCIDKLEIEVS